MTIRATLILSALCLSLAADPAAAQPTVIPQPNEGWRFNVFPVLAWVPTSIDMDLNMPPSDADSGFAGEIIDSRFDGAFLGGFSAANGTWRIDADGMWAAVGGDRQERPIFSVDADVIYFHVIGGRRIVKDLYATAGLRRLALKYVINVETIGTVERKPGVWDPLVGLGWHTEGRTFEFHGVFEGGGFGVGSDVELSGSVRGDWKPIPHFGFTAGYQLLYFKVEHTALNRPFTVKQTLHGPIVGVGFYF